MRNRDFVNSIVLAGVFFVLFCCETCSAEVGDPNSLARNPYPGDGEMNVATKPNLVLSWERGEFSDFYDIVSYYVHFDVNEANVVGSELWGAEGEFTRETSYAIAGLEPETEYFWRIDTSITSTRPPFIAYRIRGDVWSFRTMPEKAWGPEPADGAEDVAADPNVTLSCKLGDIYTDKWPVEMARYDVYYGTDPADVRGRGLHDYDFIVPVGEPIEIGPLLPRTTYYWRLNTNLASTIPPHTRLVIEGDVWSFTTSAGPPRVITVDDDGPADFDNIQAAIDDSYDGDTVLVADGTYTGDGNRDIDFRGKAITVKSENGPAACIIDCNGTEEDKHRGFYFHSGEDAKSAIIGFTIANGYAEIGGGILCEDASPSIVGCVITRNTAHLDDIRERQGGLGGGICCDNASPSVIDCEITHNVAHEGWGGGYGGGIYCDDSNALITGCRLSNNEARCHQGEILVAGYGGGIYSEDGNIIITKCVLENNSKNMGWSGAIHCLGGFSTITGCEVSEKDDNFSMACGIRLDYCRAVISNCTVSGSLSNTLNRSPVDGIICEDVSDGRIIGCKIMSNFGSGIRAEASNLTISSCMIAENFRFGIKSTMSTLEIRNCTVASNGAGGRCDYRTPCHAVHCEGASHCTIIGSILWARSYSNSPSPSEFPALDCDDAEVHYSCIYGMEDGLGGVGNIVEYPMFAETGYWDDPCNTPEYYPDNIWVPGDYHLKSQGGRWDPNEGGWVIDDVTSPCIDGGDPMTPVGPEPFANGGVINMGAYGGTAEASKSYFGGPPCEVVMAGDVNGDCVVDYRDFQLMALHWCEESG